jgi:hypothetical protein
MMGRTAGSVLTGERSRKPRLAGGVEGRNEEEGKIQSAASRGERHEDPCGGVFEK